MNSYCWLHSTYSVSSRYEGNAGQEFAHKGVGPDVNDKAGHTYHRWDDDDDDMMMMMMVIMMVIMMMMIVVVISVDDHYAKCNFPRFYQWIGFMFVLQVGPHQTSIP